MREPADPRAVEHQLQTAEVSRRAGDRGPHRHRVRHVGAVGARGATGLGDPGRGLLDRVGDDVEAGHRGALRRELNRGRATEPRARTRHERHPPVELTHLCLRGRRARNLTQRQIRTQRVATRRRVNGPPERGRRAVAPRSPWGEGTGKRFPPPHRTRTATDEEIRSPSVSAAPSPVIRRAAGSE